MTQVSFSYDLNFLVRRTLEIFINKHNELEEDKCKRMASNEVMQKLRELDIDVLLDKWSELNMGKTTLFENGLEDAEQMWGFIWEEGKWKKSYEKYVERGFNGSGVFDKTNYKFYPCEFSEHYETIQKILRVNHRDIWKVHQDFVRGNEKDSSVVDNFILENLILTGAKNSKEYYTLEERKY